MEIYRAEMGAFLAALVLLLGYRMATGRIALRGLIANPEKLLLFAATVATATVYAVKILQGGVSALPVLNTGWPVGFGICCVLYLAVEAFKAFGGRKN